MQSHTTILHSKGTILAKKIREENKGEELYSLHRIAKEENQCDSYKWTDYSIFNKHNTHKAHQEYPLLLLYIHSNTDKIIKMSKKLGIYYIISSPFLKIQRLLPLIKDN